MPNRAPTTLISLISRVYTPVALVIWMILTVSLAIAGPFGTFTYLDFHTRLFYWAVIVGLSILVGRVVRISVEEKFAQRPVWQMEVASIVMMVPILTAIIHLVTPKLLNVQSGDIPGPASLALYVATVAVLVSGVRRLRLGSQGQSPAGQGEAPPRLFRRLPEDLRGEILRLTGQDHHVEIVTTKGSATIRMRFSDAIAEMEPVKGHCTHRSHWVTHAAISGVEREPGKTFLRLVNGDRIPVSRKYRPALEQAGIV